MTHAMLSLPSHDIKWLGGHTYTHFALWRGDETKDNATLFMSVPVAGIDSAFDLCV